MISIDDSLRRAASAASAWSPRIAREVANTIARGLTADVDWDEGAGEEWLRVMDGPRQLALVSIKVPFAFISTNAEGSKSSATEIVTIDIDDFDKVQLSCSPLILAEVFGSSDRLDALDSESFSANDLWYSTV